MRSGQLSERDQGNGLGNAWFKTAKPGDEQISWKEHVERMMEGQTDAGCTMGHRAVSSAVRGPSGVDKSMLS